MQLIQTIVAHGDLTDVAFIEKTLGTKFSTSYNVTLDGKPDLQSPTYQTAYVRGSPFQATLYVRDTKLDELKLPEYRWIALLSFDNQYFPSPYTNFIQDCLRVSSSDIYSIYAVRFSEGMTVDGVIAGSTQQQGISGRNGSKLYLNIVYFLKDNLVDHVSISQQ